MNIDYPYNLDYRQALAIDTAQTCWQASPNPQVERIVLEREHAECGIATSLVRFAANSTFAAHNHPGGEEFFVLEGDFVDDDGCFTAGHYVRNPIGTSHAPHSKTGCLMFVKLHQFEESDQQQVHVDTANANWPAEQNGVQQLLLHEHHGASTSLLRLAPGAELTLANDQGGEELLIITGSLVLGDSTHAKHTWLRNPAPQHHVAGTDGCTVLAKVGHFHHAE